MWQILEQGAFKAKKVGLKVWRAARSGLIGALNNGLIHYQYYKWIDRRFPYHLFTEDKFGKPDSTYYKVGGYHVLGISFSSSSSSPPSKPHS